MGRLFDHLKLRDPLKKKHTQRISVIRHKLAFPKCFWLVLLLKCHVVVKTKANVNNNLNGINCKVAKRAKALQFVEKQSLYLFSCKIRKRIEKRRMANSFRGIKDL